MLHILHGENEFNRSEALARLRAELVDPAWGDMNTSRLDGKRITLNEVTLACDGIAFFGARVVIVDGLLTRLAARKGDRDGEAAAEPGEGAKAFLDGLAAYLPRIPDSTHLILVETKTIGKSNPVLKAAQAMGGRARITEFEPLNPRKGDLNRWIGERASHKGGAIQPAAVTLLAAYVGADLRLLDQELDKLLTYAGPRHAVTEDDVRRMVPAAAQTSIFEMVDAVAARDSRIALRLLHGLLDDGEAPLYLLFMITRQFRILLQVRLLQTANLAPSDLAQRLGQHPFVVEKASRQARQFTVPQLEAILGRLLQADLALKSSGINPVLELDMLVVGLTRGQIKGGH
ncbi:MAG: DNA polymerase III subunit delta [Anaerolineae bacterium]